MIQGGALLLGAGMLWCAVGICYEWIPEHRNALGIYLFFGGILVNLFAWTLFMPAAAPLPDVLGIAAWLIPSGFSGIPAILALKKAMKSGPEAVAWCIMQSAMICPLLTMVIVFRERLSCAAWGGIVLLFSGLFLFGFGGERRTPARAGSCWRFIVPASLAFLFTGLQQTLTVIPGKLDFSEAALSWRMPLALLPNLLWGVVFLRKDSRTMVWSKHSVWRFALLFGVACVGGEFLFFRGMDQLEKYALSGLTYPLALNFSILLFALYCRIILHKKFTRHELIAGIMTVTGIMFLAF